MEIEKSKFCFLMYCIVFFIHSCITHNSVHACPYTWDLAVCLITTITFKSYNALKPFKSSRLPPTQQTTTFTTLPCFFSSTYRYCAFKKKKKKEGNNVQKNWMLCTEQSQMEKGMFYLLPQANNLLLGCLLFCSGSFLHCRKASQAAESQAILGTLNFTECVCAVCTVLIL